MAGKRAKILSAADVGDLLIFASGCRYDKISRTCAKPDHIGTCPLPAHDLRNGRLNQTAYSLFLFIRDLAGGDLVAWIDRQLQAADGPPGPGRLPRMQAALIGPLRQVYGVSDKVLTMALSGLLLGAPKGMSLWIEVGGSMIAIDTLVHNFLHRTGILQRFNAAHPYGRACYRSGGCADIIRAVAEGIDARQFNRSYPRTFPRFSSTRSGGTAAWTGWMFATATGSTIPSGAGTWIVPSG